MRFFNGTEICPLHGEYEWSGVYYDCGEAVACRLDRIKNCRQIRKENERFIAETSCEKCHRIKEVIALPK